MNKLKKEEQIRAVALQAATAFLGGSEWGGNYSAIDVCEFSDDFVKYIKGEDF